MNVKYLIQWYLVEETEVLWKNRRSVTLYTTDTTFLNLGTNLDRNLRKSV
jgi:hypothetical protein